MEGTEYDIQDLHICIVLLRLHEKRNFDHINTLKILFLATHLRNKIG